MLTIVHILEIAPSFTMNYKSYEYTLVTRFAFKIILTLSRVTTNNEQC